MRRLLVLTSLFLATLLTVAPRTIARSDKEEVLKTINELFKTMEARDGAAIRVLFAPDGRLVSTSRHDNTQTTRVLTPDAFAKLAAETKEPYIERMIDAEVRVSGDLATVCGRYDFHVGEKLTNCGMNAFQLIRTADGWKIIHIASTIETKGCERRKSKHNRSRKLGMNVTESVFVYVSGDAMTFRSDDF